ncbi:hypothetical protein [Sphingomonas flavalba]|uniref:hypothetical protein n=1 Tax=Sphingomonas flavalba TaxID=2559804 RepID=UPI00109DAAAD|nr:hypothetical protein [Sphingomonas flavalba]
MNDPVIIATIAASSLAALALVAVAALRGWRGWLELKRMEIQHRNDAAAPPTAGSRIEIADLKERIRKLEAIAAGVDL